MSVFILLWIIGFALIFIMPMVGFPMLISFIVGITVAVIGLLTKVVPSYIAIFKKNTYYTSFKVIVFFGHFVFALISLLIVGFVTDWDIRAESVLLILLFGLIISPIYLYIYFLPYFIAYKNDHLQIRAIYILNILTGWFPIAWFIALVWSNTKSTGKKVIVNQQIQQSSADELAKYKDLLDRGIITQEEFETKKKQLLDL